MKTYEDKASDGTGCGSMKAVEATSTFRVRPISQARRLC